MTCTRFQVSTDPGALYRPSAGKKGLHLPWIQSQHSVTFCNVIAHPFRESHCEIEAVVNADDVILDAETKGQLVDFLLLERQFGLAPMDFGLDGERSQRDLQRCSEITDQLGELDYGAAKKENCLTPQEERILELILQGRKNSAIVEAFFISPETVRWHKRRLYRKVGRPDLRKPPDSESRLVELSSGKRFQSYKGICCKQHQMAPGTTQPA